jgi:hypothetical protein
MRRAGVVTEAGLSCTRMNERCRYWIRRPRPLVSCSGGITFAGQGRTAAAEASFGRRSVMPGTNACAEAAPPASGIEARWAGTRSDSV